jgi:predicted membrane channel-forming protein YqfA (hemolysin III family)
MPRWVRMLGVAMLFAFIVGALVPITGMFLHHPNRFGYRVIALLWIIGTFGLLLIVAKGLAILRETETSSNW